jgi:hypothetical protein
MAIFAIGTYYVAIQLYNAREWTIFTKSICAFISDCAVFVSFIGFSSMNFVSLYSLTFLVLSHLPVFRQVDIPYLDVPKTFGPAVDRPWLVDIAVLPFWAFFLAIIPGMALTILFYFDHNLSSALTQKKENCLKKGTAYDWDFLIVGLIMLICSFFGLPFANALLPQSPLHVKSVTTVETDGDDEKITGVRENRITSLLHAVLIAILTIFGRPILILVPDPVNIGLFLFLGETSCYDTQFLERIKFIFTRRQFYRKFRKFQFIRKVSRKKIILFTLVQLVCLAIITVITLSPLSLIFPMFIVLMIPFRKIAMVKMFSVRKLEYLDNDDLDFELPPDPEDEDQPDLQFDDPKPAATQSPPPAPPPPPTQTQAEQE